MADLDPQAVQEAAEQWAAYQEGKRAGEPHDEAAEGAEAGVKLPGKLAPLCECGHREYDHDTPDATCWKCLCPEYRPDDRTNNP